MLIPSHTIMGASTYIAVAPLIGMNPTDPIAISIAVVASGLPDLDTTKSWLGRKFFLISFILETTLGHRTWSHSIWPLLLIALSFLIWPQVWFIIAPIFIGYAIHLLGDIMTEGVPLLYGYSPKRTGLYWGRTGGFQEVYISAAFAVVAFLLTKNYWF